MSGDTSRFGLSGDTSRFGLSGDTSAVAFLRGEALTRLYFPVEGQRSVPMPEPCFSTLIVPVTIALAQQTLPPVSKVTQRLAAPHAERKNWGMAFAYRVPEVMPIPDPSLLTGKRHEVHVGALTKAIKNQRAV